MKFFFFLDWPRMYWTDDFRLLLLCDDDDMCVYVQSSSSIVFL